MTSDLAPAFDLSLYRSGLVATCFYATAALCTAGAAIAASGRTAATDARARRAFVINVSFVILLLLALGGRHAAGSAEQATAVLRLALAIFAGLGPSTVDFVAALVGTRPRLRAAIWLLAAATAALALGTRSVVAGGHLENGAIVIHGGPGLALVFAIMLVESGAALRVAWRAARAAGDTPRRRQLRAVIAAYAIGPLGGLDALRLAGLPLPPTSFVFLGAAAVVLIYAFRAHHLLDTPDLGWRSLAWLCASVIAAAPLGAVLLETDGWSGWHRPLAAALALEALYLLLRAYGRWVQPAIDDLFMRRRRDLDRDLDALTEALLVVRTIPAVADEVARVVGRALYARGVLCAVRGDAGEWRALPPTGGVEPLSDGHPLIAALAARGDLLTGEDAAALDGADEVRRFFTATRAAAVVPLAGRAGLLGLIAVAHRRDGAPFVPVEIDFLRRVAPVVSAAIGAARLYDRRQALRRELEDRVAARARELASARESLERAQDDIVRREKLATLGLVVGGVAAELETAVASAARAVQGIEADLAACEGEAERALAGAGAELGAFAAEAQLDDVRRDVRPLVAAIAEGARRARVISRDLSLFARPAPECGRIDLAREIDAALALLGPELGARTEVVREVADDLPAVPGDGGAIGQVLMNLLANAAQAIEGQGTIRVRAALLDGGDRVEISIRDSGKGIPPENVGRLFEPFFTTKPSGARGGSGLGLFVSQGIVERHGGQVLVDTKPGVGSEFRVVLPVRPVAARSH